MNLTRTQWNLLANFAGQASNAGLAFLVIPWFVDRLGQEAYGVVGFYTSLQTVITIFDFGISTAANRELARLSTQPDAGNAMRSLLTRLQLIYWAMAILFGSALFLLAPLLAEHWLNLDSLHAADVTVALQWMAVALALQWPSILYINCISGLQQQSWLNLVQIATSVARFPGTLLLLVAWSPTLDVFFIAQCGASILQSAALFTLLIAITPVSQIGAATVEWRNLRAFAAGIGSLSVLNLVLTQYDKLLLSNLLPLSEFSYYAQACTLVGGIGIVTLPIVAAVFPRYSQLVAAGQHDELRQLYHHSCQLMSALLLPLSLAMMLFPETILYVWTGNEQTARHAATMLRLVALAMTLYCVIALPYNLQYAHGRTRILLAITGTGVGVFLPLGYWWANWAGAEGAAAAMCVVLLGMFAIGIPILHRRLIPGDGVRWYLADIALPLAPVLAIDLVLLLFDAPTTRLGGALLLGAAVTLGSLAALVAVPVTRQRLLDTMRKFV